jgi:hypothetical protein
MFFLEDSFLQHLNGSKKKKEKEKKRKKDPSSWGFFFEGKDPSSWWEMQISS